MRLVVLIGVLSMLLPVASASGQPENEGPARPNSLEAGMTAVQFVIKAEPFRSFASGIEGAVKRHHSDGGALRLGFAFNWSNNEFSEEDEFSDPVNGDAVYTSRSVDDYWTISADLLWIGYPIRGGLVNLYWGLGPTAGFGKRDFTRERFAADAESSDRLDERSSDLWTVGAKGLLGAEWFAVERISLYLEYRAWVTYSSEDGKSVSTYGDQTRQSTLDGSRWRVDSNAVLAGLAAYF